MSLLAHRGLFMAAGSAAPTDPFYSSVTSLLHFDGADGSSTFTDQKSVTWSRGASNAELDTAQAKFGPSSLFSNTTGYIGAPTAGNFDFGTGDFTLECWVRPSTIASFQTIFSHRTSGFGNDGLTFRITNTGKLEAFRSAGLNIMTGTTTMSASDFQHVALCRVGGTWRIFLNGVQEGTNAIGVANVSTGASTTSYIGVYGDQGLTTERLSSGWIDDFRATKGVGRYSAGFTPPTAAFPNS